MLATLSDDTPIHAICRCRRKCAARRRAARIKLDRARARLRFIAWRWRSANVLLFACFILAMNAAPRSESIAFLAPARFACHTNRRRPATAAGRAAHFYARSVSRSAKLTRARGLQCIEFESLAAATPRANCHRKRSRFKRQIADSKRLSLVNDSRARRSCRRAAATLAIRRSLPSAARAGKELMSASSPVSSSVAVECWRRARHRCSRGRLSMARARCFDATTTVVFLSASTCGAVACEQRRRRGDGGGGDCGGLAVDETSGGGRRGARRRNRFVFEIWPPSPLAFAATAAAVVASERPLHDAPAALTRPLYARDAVGKRKIVADCRDLSGRALRVVGAERRCTSRCVRTARSFSPRLHVATPTSLRCRAHRVGRQNAARPSPVVAIMRCALVATACASPRSAASAISKREFSGSVQSGRAIESSAGRRTKCD